MKRALVVSPHLDDAALSSGATIAYMTANDVKTTVVTVFAGLAAPPYSVAAARLHDTWRLDSDPVGVRREEDIRAIRLLGGDAVHGDFYDAIYRRYSDGTWIIGDDGVPSRKDRESDLFTSIQRWIEDAICRFRPHIVLTCAAIGDHLDHRLTRDAVLAAVDGRNVHLRLWEDIPYCIWNEQRTRDESVSPPEAIEVSDDRAWSVKYEAVASYASQLRMLWPKSDFREDLERHARSRAAEHFGEGRGEVFWSHLGDLSNENRRGGRELRRSINIRGADKASASSTRLLVDAPVAAPSGMAAAIRHLPRAILAARASRVRW